jgi:hypothetical protein
MPAPKSFSLTRRLRRFVGRGGAIYALLYLATLAGGPLLDAGVERASGSGAPHVESEQSAGCPVHDHEECQVCRTLRTLPLASVAIVMAPVADAHVTSSVHVSDAPGASPLNPSQFPRAPPLS